MEVSENNTIKKESEEKWYALYTRPRAEKLVYKRLVDIGIETFLPIQKTLRQWSDRKKIVEKPLIPSYIFVKTKSKFFPTVYNTDGVVSFIRFEGKPVCVTQREIDNLRLLVDSNADIELSSEKFEKGEQVKVTTGPLNGLTGELISSGDKKKVLVRIESLDKNIVVTIHTAFLAKVHQKDI